MAMLNDQRVIRILTTRDTGHTETSNQNLVATAWSLWLYPIELLTLTSIIFLFSVSLSAFLWLDLNSMFSWLSLSIVASFHQLGEVPKLLPSCDLLPGSKGLQCGRSQSSKDGAKLNGSNSRADGWFTHRPSWLHSCQGAFLPGNIHFWMTIRNQGTKQGS